MDWSTLEMKASRQGPSTYSLSRIDGITLCSVVLDWGFYSACPGCALGRPSGFVQIIWELVQSRHLHQLTPHESEFQQGFAENVMADQALTSYLGVHYRE